MDTTGIVFDIKRFAVHDGPGVRTVVFLKGCPLSCAWCHNPEGIQRQPELVWFENRCIGCGACVAACPSGARETIHDQRVYHRELCQLCGRCLEACYAGALLQYGKALTLEEVMAVVRQDADFYRASGGGVTLSGGEPLAQPEFAMRLLRQCKAEGYHNALDTSGHIPWRILEKALEHTDLVLYDLKHLNPDRHQFLTGVDNTLILENLRRLDRLNIPLEIRIPLVPGLNDGDNLLAACALLKSLHNQPCIRLLPYHNLAGSKYQRLGAENRLAGLESPTPAEIAAAAALLRSSGCEVIE